MNINLSDVVWTVICFVLFMLVLNGLLLKPVLKNIDARKEKIRRAELEAEERETEREEKQKQMLRENELAAERAREERKKRLAEESEKAEKEIADLAASLAESEDAAMKEIAALSEETDERLAEQTGGMADAFTEKLMTGGDV